MKQKTIKYYIILFTFLSLIFSSQLNSQNKIRFENLSGKSIRFSIPSNTKHIFVFYHIISCYECYFEIDRYFSSINQKYYLVIPYSTSKSIPIKRLKMAIYLFDKFINKEVQNIYSITPETRSNLYIHFEMFQYPSILVLDSNGFTFHPYKELFKFTHFNWK